MEKPARILSHIHWRHENILSYLVANHHESLATIRNVRELYPQVLIPPNPTVVESSHPILQIILGLAASIPRRRYHHHVYRVWRVERRE